MQFWSLNGLTSYEAARELQLKLVELRAADSIPDTILFLEHEPVITRGRGLQFTGAPRPRHMPVPVMLPPGVTFCESERGGDLTYHGPGQLVVYPICKLDGKGGWPNHDIAGFLRQFERFVIDEIEALGRAHGVELRGESREHATGVWVGDRKVASMGIAVRKWVTYHGIAINCVNDLGHFHLISPCGFAPEVMARLSDFLPAAAMGADWRSILECRLATRMSGGRRSPEIRRLDPAHV